MSYATLYTDKERSARTKNFGSYEELRSYLMGEVIVSKEAGDMHLSELISVYNAQYGDYVEMTTTGMVAQADKNAKELMEWMATQ